MAAPKKEQQQQASQDSKPLRSATERDERDRSPPAQAKLARQHRHSQARLLLMAAPKKEQQQQSSQDSKPLVSATSDSEDRSPTRPKSAERARSKATRPRGGRPQSASARLACNAARTYPAYYSRPTQATTRAWRPAASSASFRPVSPTQATARTWRPVSGKDMAHSSPRRPNRAQSRGRAVRSPPKPTQPRPGSDQIATTTSQRPHLT